MIGGFGSLNGQIDFWDLENIEEIGNCKSELAVGLDWAPDGLSFMTSVYYETVKVDNDFRFFSLGGTALLPKPKEFEELHSCQIQPGSYPKPNLHTLKKAIAKKKDAQPKKTFVMPGGNNDAFSQMMRQ
jgi:translation initiation factor 2A